ncbi:MAG: radical SAM protein [Candidatus Nealsonbacteria bacterium]|nr:radical SAM protein [Candidatus Nealsonbacteria bacterium]
MSQKRFYIFNDDVCIRLRLHGEDIKELLIKNAWIETKDQKSADIILVNTCSFIKNAEDAAIAKLEKIIAGKGIFQEIVVFGCLPDINPARLREIHRGTSLSGRDTEGLIGIFDLKRFERKIGHRITRQGPISTRIIKYLNRLLIRDDYFTYLFDKEKVFHLKISEGCLGQCAYCAERLARGSLKSKMISEIMKEFHEGLSQNYRIFSLNADDVGLFGQDNQENIAQLLEEMLKIDKDFKLVITEFNPWALLKYRERIADILASPKIVFITVPLESGSQKILQLMKRPYILEKIMPILLEIKSKNTGIKINTHIIVGFPGETEDDFNETLGLFDRFYFNKVKIFRYSERPNTEAVLMPDKINEGMKKERQKAVSRKVFQLAVKRLDIKAILLNKIGF